MLQTYPKTTKTLLPCILVVALAFLVGAAPVVGDEPPAKPALSSEVEAAVLVVRRGQADPLAKPGADDYLATHVVLLRSPLLLQKAVAKGKLAALASLAKRDPIVAIGEGLTVRRDPNASGSVLVLGFEGGDPKDGVAILAALVDAYRDFLDETFRNASDGVLDQVTRARDLLERDISETEKRHREFLDKAPLIGLPSGTSSSQGRLTAVEAKTTALLIGRAEIQSRLDALEKALQSTDGRVAALLKAQEWAARSGFDKLPEEVKKGTDPLKAYLASVRQELEDSRAIEATLDQLSHSEQKVLQARSVYETQDEQFRADLARLRQLHDATVKRLVELNLNRDAEGFAVSVLTPPRVKGPQPRKKEKPEAVADGEFTGKVVFVETAAANNSATLEQVELKQLGDRSFLVGRVVKKGDLTRGDFNGMMVWLPLAEVKRIVVLEEVKKP